jgi:hypothetical protein
MFHFRRLHALVSVVVISAAATAPDPKANGAVLPRTFRIVLVDYKPEDAVPARPPGMVPITATTPVSPPATPPAPATPTTAPTPPPPPPPPPEDDPIGGGGFITPPSSFKALLCIPQDLVDTYSFNDPDPGSKMEAFKDLAASFIVSVAKPDWQYWIEEGQFERFDPATATGDQIVSQISPDSGRFDVFDPHCPANTAAYTIGIER